MSAIQKAIRENDFDQTVRILTDTPLAADHSEQDEPLPIFTAARYGSLKILQYLVEYSRASLDVYDANHRNALFYAVLSGDLKSAAI